MLENSEISWGFLDKVEYVDAAWIKQALKKDAKFQEMINVASNQGNAKAILDLGISLASGAKNIVLCGIGGSLLAGMAFYEVIKTNIRNNIIFLDNLDSAAIDAKLLSINLKDTIFIFISKSGNTIETVLQMVYVIDLLTSHGFSKAAVSQRCIAITANKESQIGKIATKFQIDLVDWSGNISGRFSAFSNNINLMNAIFGLEVLSIMDEFTNFASNALSDPRFIENVNFSIASIKQGLSSNIMFAYNSKLGMFLKWYIQLWSESIGKSGIGTNPCDAIGPLDQHSKLQLYLDGPRDKLFTIIGEKYSKKDALNWNDFLDCGVDVLVGSGINSAVNASFFATHKSLSELNLPIRKFEFDSIDVSAMVRLMSFFMLETILCCHYFELNPYDQPRVEESKRNLYDRLLKNRSI